MQKISFTVDGLRLSGTIFYPPNPKEKNPGIFFVQGWTSKKERSYQYAEALSKLGYACFLFDNKGHGESEGDVKQFTIREFLNGVVGAYDFLLTIKGIDKDNINAVGQSFGGYLIALLSENRNINRLVLRAAADYPNEDFDKSKSVTSGVTTPEVLAWRNQVRTPNDTFAMQALSSFNGDILIIESGGDDIVPHQTTDNYINAIKNRDKLTHVIVKDAPHSIREGRFRDEITDILVEWFKDKL
jgi:uncharacterized protein